MNLRLLVSRALPQLRVWSAVFVLILMLAAIDAALERNVLAQSTGLIAHYPLDDGSGADADDVVGGNNGTLTNGPVWTSGKVGGALSFDGSNDYVNIGQPSALNLTGAMTAAAWVWLDDYDQPSRIIAKMGNSGKRGWSLNVEYTPQREAAFMIAKNATTLVSVNSGTPIPTGEWVHMAGVYEPGVALRLYVNGTLVKSNTTAIPASQYNPPLNVNIGRRAEGGLYWDGKLDEVRVYNRALTSAEIAQVYSSGTTVPPTITLLATPAFIPEGGTSTISWTTTDATSCTASGGWSGAKNLSGTEDVSPTQDTTYTLTCTGEGGTSEQSKSVQVLAPFSLPPSLGRVQTFILTDIGNDRDDEQSLVRLLHYANDLSIVGFSVGYAPNAGGTELHPELIVNALTAYDTVDENLRLHDSRYPTAASLSPLMVTDDVSDPHAIGQEFDTESSERIIAALDASEEPIWFLIWGGPRALMQALWKVTNTRSPAEVAEFKSKIRVYDVIAQDNSYTYARDVHPDLFYMLSVYPGLIRGMYSTDAPTTMLTKTWVTNNITTGHGPLGAFYPIYSIGGPSTWGSNQGVKEGDTPSFFHILPLGLSDPNHPEWGGWGGRFRHTVGNRYEDGSDTWNTLTNIRVTVARWRDAYQPDFQGRMDWDLQSVANTNHPPVVNVEGDETLKPVFAFAEAGQTVTFDASASSDPDGNSLIYKWFYYPEPSEQKTGVTITGATSHTATVSVPASDKSIHIILEVRDSGSPVMTRYRRIIINPTQEDQQNLTYGSIEGGTVSDVPEAIPPAAVAPLAHYPFENSPEDIVGTNEGEISGNPTFATGKVGQAIVLDGNDSVSVANNSLLTMQGKNTFTLSTWIWHGGSGANWQAIVSKGAKNATQQYAITLNNPSNYIHFETGTISCGALNTPSNTITNNTWHHVVAVYDGSQKRVYIDGTLQASAPCTGTLPANTQNIRIGAHAGSGEFFVGSIDDVRIYDTALTPEEVTALFTGDEQAQAVFPGAIWATRTPAQLGLSEAKLLEFRNETGNQAGFVVKDGYQVYSWGNSSQKFDWASAAKPLFSTMLFFALLEGKLSSVDALIANEEWNVSAKDQTMTFHHLANMTSGYSLPEAPGTRWAYNDYAIMLYAKTLFERVFVASPDSVVRAPTRLGQLQFQDGALFGTARGGFGVVTSLRDYARVGWFWLNKGSWSGTQLLPQSYFDDYMKPHTTTSLARTDGGFDDYLTVGTFGGNNNQDFPGQGSYGYNWWFNTNGDIWPDAPADTILALGHLHQENMVIIPSLNMVVAWRGIGASSYTQAQTNLNNYFKLLKEASI